MGRRASTDSGQLPRPATHPRRSGAFAAALITAAVGLGTALVFVRGMLDWSDSQPYEDARTETRYLVLMAVALAMCVAAALAAWRISRRVHRAANIGLTDAETGPQGQLR
ncbi:hypothetical protein [Leucobacter chromiireducens]|uniref:hypothetical protein n=1 Tax=Leucobacter chromiireducens TaxID=283877 RepID=UPI003F809122